MKETGNAMIEEAIFILKSGSSSKETMTDADIIKHANAILDKGCRADKFPLSVYDKPKHKTRTFISGALTGILAALLIFLVF